MKSKWNSPNLIGWSGIGNENFDAIEKLNRYDIIEKYTYEKDLKNTQYRLKDAQFNLYKTFANASFRPKLEKTYTLKTSTPILASNFVYPFIDWNTELLNFDSRLELENTYLVYDKKGNLICKKDKNGIPYSMKYDTLFQLPLAIFSNAVDSNKKMGADVGFTSFEYSDLPLNNQNSQISDFWENDPTHTTYSTDAYSGNYSCKIANQGNGMRFGPSREFIPTKQMDTYEFSAWVKPEIGFGTNKGGLTLEIWVDGVLNNNHSGNWISTAFSEKGDNWQAVSILVDLAKYRQINNVSATSKIKIRAYSHSNNTNKHYLIDHQVFKPKGSFAELYTYDASGRKTSYTNPEGKIEHYEYNGFGELIFIKDYKKNIRQSFGSTLRQR